MKTSSRNRLGFAIGSLAAVCLTLALVACSDPSGGGGNTHRRSLVDSFFLSERLWGVPPTLTLRGQL